jgi:hypothetical protein
MATCAGHAGGDRPPEPRQPGSVRVAAQMLVQIVVGTAPCAALKAHEVHVDLVKTRLLMASALQGEVMPRALYNVLT